MKKSRQEQIALKFTKYRFREEGINITPDLFTDQIPKIARGIGITYEEATEFALINLREILDEAIAKAAQPELAHKFWDRTILDE